MTSLASASAWSLDLATRVRFLRRKFVQGKGPAMAEDPRDWEIETRAVRGGMARSPYGEISEALFLTQGFAYPTAEAADRRFGGEPGFIYQRFGNPTTAMFEDRLALMEGAESCRATASGMAAIHVTLMDLFKAADL